MNWHTTTAATLFECDADPFLFPPYKATRPSAAISWSQQDEMLWDSNWANVEHRAGVRPVANHAGERAATKLNCCGLQNAIPAGAALTHRLPRKEP